MRGAKNVRTPLGARVSINRFQSSRGQIALELAYSNMNKHNRKECAIFFLMNLYLDSSALAKPYIAEVGHEAVTNAIKGNQVAVCIIALTELGSAFARREREGYLTAAERRQALAKLEQDWGKFISIDIDYTLSRIAASMAQKHGLKALDALHLAAAAELHRTMGNTEFLAFDKQLMRAAARELPVYKL